MERDTPRQSNESLSVLRNERLTALAGAVLFVLIVAELIVTANLHALISVHIFVGVLLAGPLIVKMASTGYRFLRYYTGNQEFVRKGPPHILLRLMAPLLVLFTLLVFVSGFGLAVVGPHHLGLMFKIHAASVALWIPLVAVHFYAHARKVPRLIKSDLAKRASNRISGGAGRLVMNILGIVVGLIAAILMIPVSKPWNNWHIHHGAPSPLVAGIFAAAIGVWIGIPLLRKVVREQ